MRMWHFHICAGFATLLSVICCSAILVHDSFAEETNIVFNDVTEQLGLNGLSNGTASWGDYNNDGWADLYAGGQLWKNEKGKKFVRVDGGKLSGDGIWGDYDNDGFLDLFIWQGKGRLYHNISGERLEVVENVLPELPTKVSLGATWGDFNGDGFLDLYVGGYETWQVANYVDVIYFNQGGKSFKEVWRTPGKAKPARGVTAADFDEDGDLDIYVSNYRLVYNLLWRNDGKGQFEEVGNQYGVWGDGALGAWGHTIGSAWGDLDNDGYLDLFVGNFSHPPDYQDRPKFLKNLGPDGKYHFKDMSQGAGLHWQESYASPALGDFDNDGKLDLFFTTVYPGDRSVLYRNLGGWKFRNVTSGSNVNRPTTYQGAWADFNHDGYLDLVTGGRLFQNPGGKYHWLKVKLIGSGEMNRDAIGGKVRVVLNGEVLTRQVETGTGQGNQNDMVLHFGLGSHGGEVEIEVMWPDGKKEKRKVKVNQLLKWQYGQKSD